MLFPVYAFLCASILDFKAKLGNRCMLFPVYAFLRASILDFRPRLENRCSTIVVAVENSTPAAQSWGAGRDRMPRRRHNPKKKPPEWHLSLLRQRPASDSNFRSVKEGQRPVKTYFRNILIIFNLDFVYG